ncbi:hypothetical protein PVAP13_8KG361104 [Panicum virgatum]|uniref:Uncharacterized protein n=1 Tax=Panicum virgatum TaxID=38727 RepID=A0A8T0PRP2_PANVG|nr:hypothetical protein PVAP13_8KG361104 [Panicum virgatum]
MSKATHKDKNFILRTTWNGGGEQTHVQHPWPCGTSRAAPLVVRREAVAASGGWPSAGRLEGAYVSAHRGAAGGAGLEGFSRPEGGGRRGRVGAVGVTQWQPPGGGRGGPNWMRPAGGGSSWGRPEWAGRRDPAGLGAGWRRGGQRGAIRMGSGPARGSRRRGWPVGVPGGVGGAARGCRDPDRIAGGGGGGVGEVVGCFSLIWEYE